MNYPEYVPKEVVTDYENMQDNPEAHPELIKKLIFDPQMIEIYQNGLEKDQLVTLFMLSIDAV